MAQRKMTAKGTRKKATKLEKKVGDMLTTPAKKPARKAAPASALGNEKAPAKAEVKEVKVEPKEEKKRVMKDETLHSVTSPDGKLSVEVLKLNENPPRLAVIRHIKNDKRRIMRVAQSSEALAWLLSVLPTCAKFMESGDKPKAEKPAKAQKKTAKAKAKATAKKAPAPEADDKAKGLDIDDLLG